MNLNNATEIIARREFSPVYMIFDVAFLLCFAAMLIVKKKYMTVLVGALAGILYMIVDYGIFTLSAIREAYPRGTAFFLCFYGCR